MVISRTPFRARPDARQGAGLVIINYHAMITVTINYHAMITIIINYHSMKTAYSAMMITRRLQPEFRQREGPF